MSLKRAHVESRSLEARLIVCRTKIPSSFQSTLTMLSMISYFAAVRSVKRCISPGTGVPSINSLYFFIRVMCAVSLFSLMESLTTQTGGSYTAIIRHRPAHLKKGLCPCSTCLQIMTKSATTKGELQCQSPYYVLQLHAVRLH